MSTPSAPNKMLQQFASDNFAGMCPSALDYFVQANNSGHELAYGNDRWTQKVCDAVRSLFNTDCEVYFVFNGTAANSLALASLTLSYQAVICHELAHVETDECGGPEFFSNGAKLLIGKGDNGKLTPSEVVRLATRRTDIHYPKPKALSITQSTEVGTVYTVDEILALTSVAQKYNLRVQMDGARFANACASLNVHPADITWKAGVDVLCFGGTKNGLPVGEMVVFFNKALGEDFDARVKQSGQLASKMRFISALWLGLLDHEVWLKNARHANAMATLLAEKLRPLPNINILFPVSANAVFVSLPMEVEQGLRAHGWLFHNFIGAGGCRLMCSWDTTPDTIEAFVNSIKTLLDIPLEH